MSSNAEKTQNLTQNKSDDPLKELGIHRNIIGLYFYVLFVYKTVCNMIQFHMIQEEVFYNPPMMEAIFVTTVIWSTSLVDVAKMVSTITGVKLKPSFIASYIWWIRFTFILTPICAFFSVLLSDMEFKIAICNNIVFITWAIIMLYSTISCYNYQQSLNESQKKTVDDLQDNKSLTQYEHDSSQKKFNMVEYIIFVCYIAQIICLYIYWKNGYFGVNDVKDKFNETRKQRLDFEVILLLTLYISMLVIPIFKVIGPKFIFITSNVWIGWTFFFTFISICFAVFPSEIEFKVELYNYSVSSAWAITLLLWIKPNNYNRQLSNATNQKTVDALRSTSVVPLLLV